MPDPAIQKITGISDLAANYDALLVDVWGVLHQGEGAFPAALECLAGLRSADIPVVLVSNAARRGDVLRAELAGSGITPDLYHDAIASGELTWRALANGEPDFTRGVDGYFFGPVRSHGLRAGLDIVWRERPEEAGFVLNTGPPEGNPPSADVCDAFLERMAASKLPMICANPDQVAVRGGMLGISAGAIARRYRDRFDARVVFFGKPDPDVFVQAASLLPAGRSDRLLVVGDAFATDIAGANAAGLDSLLVGSGIHAGDIGADEVGDVARLASGNGAFPTWYAAELRW